MLRSEEQLSKPARVKLSTIHAAKGGEATNVLLILDNTKKIRDAIEKSEDKHDEEHRVWYVGVTRTKQNLYIMTAKQEDKGYDIESIT
jgi:superfamily I DNA/RNA helicase